jgi:hypothetical protein
MLSVENSKETRYSDRSRRTQRGTNRAYGEVVLGNNLTLRRARGLLFNTMTDQQTR